MAENKITAADIAADPNVKALWALLIGQLVGRHMLCTCCGTTKKEDDERILDLLRGMGFGEAVARAEKVFNDRHEQARRERRWCGGPYHLIVVAGSGDLLKCLIEDAESVFEKSKPR